MFDLKCGIEEKISKYNYEKKLKKTAGWKVQKAILLKRIILQPCELCGAQKVDAHHENYEKPLDVHWLCRKCHLRVHRQKAGGYMPNGYLSNDNLHMYDYLNSRREGNTEKQSAVVQALRRISGS